MPLLPRGAPIMVFIGADVVCVSDTLGAVEPCTWQNSLLVHNSLRLLLDALDTSEFSLVLLWVAGLSELIFDHMSLCDVLDSFIVFFLGIVPT